ncbi:MAG: 3'-5' exonuclease [Proteobacteria bacterium]|nr:3'-5' exonuclease [Pseudomonadota bacterium]MBU1233366.1 3'-5' exonuclease [Pseudomonadota bacterium]MBU1417655.1 3'-5' exonuclease [Pseudomonadota bacterium]MBU1456160.1 3'-5' exonuclease [Pseudomonadota bacterium]
MFDLLKPATWFSSPDPLLRKNKACFADFDQNRPLAEYTFVVCDTELTGLDWKKDELISIGAVMIKDLQIDLASTFHHFVRPRNMAHTQATLVHRITPEQLQKARPIEVVLPQFLEFINGSLLVGHHLLLDMHFLNKAAKEVLGGTLSNPGVDTMRMAQGYKRVRLGHYHEHNPREISYNLEDLGREYNLPIFMAHDALEDAMQTAYLFLYFIKKFRKGGLVTLKDIYQAGRVGSLRY